MSASATATFLYAFRDQVNVRRCRIRVDITGLQAGANTIAHGIQPVADGGNVPLSEEVLLTSAVAVHRTQPADSTNLYYTVDSGTGTTISVYCDV